MTTNHKLRKEAAQKLGAKGGKGARGAKKRRPASFYRQALPEARRRARAKRQADEANDSI